MIGEENREPIYDLKKLVATIDHVPDEWIYKYYYAKFSESWHNREPWERVINQPFDGRSIKVKSITSSDSKPSLFFFYKNGRYFWKDFSVSGMGGDAVQFVCKHMSKYEAAAKDIIINDFQTFNTDGKEIKIFNKKDIVESVRSYDVEFCSWSTYHMDYWKKFNIDLNILASYRIKPIKNYTMNYDKDRSHFSPAAGALMFGYCRLVHPVTGSVRAFQIYQPNHTSVKYVYLDTSYMIGEDQLEFKSDTCVISSGLKDLMALRTLNLDLESVAPLSETIMLPSHKIDLLRSRFKNIVTLFDPDAAGYRSARRYKNAYGIEGVVHPFSGDTADNCRDYPYDYLRSQYSFCINKAINRSHASV